MGGLGKGGSGGEGGGFGAFLPLLLVLLICFIVFRIIIRKYKKKGLRESICHDCLIVYTKGEKFCKKCGNSLTEK